LGKLYLYCDWVYEPQVTVVIYSSNLTWNAGAAHGALAAAFR
jgi:hypothetical protein